MKTGLVPPGAVLSPSGRWLVPNTIIGYTKRGLPIRVQAGGSGETGGAAPAPAAPAPTGAGSTSGDGGDGPTPTLDAITAVPAGGATPPATAPAPPPAPTPAPATQPAAPAAPAAPTVPAVPVTPEPPANAKVEDLPAWAQTHIKALRDENAKARTGLAEQKKATETVDSRLSTLMDGLAGALGLKTEETAAPPDPEKLVGDLAARTTQLRDANVRLAVWELASKPEVGANTAHLMDSASFLRTLAGLDPEAVDFTDKLGAAVTAAVAADPTRFKAPAAQAAHVPSGGDFTGGPGGRTKPEDMSVDDFRAAMRKGSQST